jgi:hypothetical protein
MRFFSDMVHTFYQTPSPRFPCLPAEVYLQQNLPWRVCRWLLWSECVPQTPHVRNAVPEAAVLRSGTFKMWLSHKANPYTNGLMPASQVCYHRNGVLIEDEYGPFLLLCVHVSTLFHHVMPLHDSVKRFSQMWPWDLQLPSF